MAIAFRHLADIGFAENMAGHITWQSDGQSDMYVNPWGLWWQELTASDICVVDEEARVVRGRWDVTPAIHLHTEIHRVRPDARVVVHNHPYYVSLIAALGTLPTWYIRPARCSSTTCTCSRSTTARSTLPGGQPNWPGTSDRPTW